MDKDNKDSKDNKDNKDNKDDKVKKDKDWLEAQIEANIPPVPINTSTYTYSLNTGEMNSEIKEEIYKHSPLYVNSHNSYSIGTSGSLYMDEDV
ncbi:19861_t:CDS:2 [Rhizophagus irregularis]|nr:19861_t:CDS:2 [Rhizophagus irregularis]